jgi:DNA-binding MarR family transcriptional regulator
MNKKGFEIQIFLKQGKLRKDVLNSLTEPKTATDIAKEIWKHRSSISRVLIELEKKGLVKCINPDDDKFRHYVKK